MNFSVLLSVDLVQSCIFARFAVSLCTSGIELAVAADAADDDDALIAEIMAFAASHLSEQEQRILSQRFTHGLRYSEIASAEGISRVAVWKHLSHALNEIKKHFNPKTL